MFLLISFIVGAIAALWVYHDASRRGHTLNKVLAWSFGTLAASIIKFPFLLLILAIYLFVGRKGSLQEKRDTVNVIDVEATIVEDLCLECPACGRKVEENFALCPYCGRKLQNPSAKSE